MGHMKTYKFTASGRKYTGLGLTQDAKQEIVDVVVAEGIEANDRRLAKGLISSVSHDKAAKLILATKFVSEAVSAFLQTEEGGRVIDRAMVTRDDGKELTDEDIDAVWEAQAAGGHVGLVFRQMFEDAYPKFYRAKTRENPTAGSPSSPPTPTPGGGDSPASPSTSTPESTESTRTASCGTST